ncbi:hypothetical protein K438DRAFT_1055101 [Mycena galopus ATCC 62051]|nr:hypothetical protein K438DRAFT_1055101 [Mycena galopus ATCC 62051]
MYSWTLVISSVFISDIEDSSNIPVIRRQNGDVNIHQRTFPHYSSEWLLFVIPFVANIVTLLFIFPTLASLVKRTYGTSEKSGRLLARSLAQNPILIGALCSIGMVVFGGRRLGLLHALFFFVYPFSVGALAALYSLAASYFAAVGRGSELGALFGALSIWVT